MIATLGGGLALAVAAANAQQPIDQRYATTDAPSIHIDGPIGSLRVIGWAYDSVAVTGMLAAPYALNGGILKDQSGGRFLVEQRVLKGAFDGSGKGTSLELRLPRNGRVWIKTVAGLVSVSGVDGGVDVNVVGGSVQVSGAPRQLNVESMEANVTIDGSADWLRVKTADGDVTMSGSSPDAAFTTVSGTIHVGDGQFERAKFESVSGPMIFSGDPARGASIDFNTHNGAIELRLAPKTKIGTRIEATSIAGTITDSLTSGMHPTVDGRGQSLTTTIGFTPGGVITIQAYKGTIVLRPK